MPPLPSSVSLPAWPKSWSLPEPPVSVSLPAPPNRLAAGSAPLASLSVIESLPPWPKTWITAVLATVAWPPATATAPPLTSMVPAASRLTVMVLLRLSPNTDSKPAAGEKLALIAMVVILSADRWFAAASRQWLRIGVARHSFGGPRGETKSTRGDTMQTVDQLDVSHTSAPFDGSTLKPRRATTVRFAHVRSARLMPGARSFLIRNP